MHLQNGRSAGNSAHAQKGTNCLRNLGQAAEEIQASLVLWSSATWVRAQIRS
jgi:hypothetical protein